MLQEFKSSMRDLAETLLEMAALAGLFGVAYFAYIAADAHQALILLQRGQ